MSTRRVKLTREIQMNGSKILTLPTIFVDQPAPFLNSIAVQGVRGIAQVEQHIVEEGLESWNRGTLFNK